MPRQANIPGPLNPPPASSGGGVTDHGALTGLGDDDHPQYHNDARGDARYSLLAHTHESDTTGTSFPTSGLYDGQPFYRTDLHEDFRYDSTIAAWLGELRTDGFGTSGTVSNGVYLRRYNGMTCSATRGIGPLAFDIVLVEINGNWSTSQTGDMILRRSGTAVHTIAASGTSFSQSDLLVEIASGGVLAFTNNSGGSVSAFQVSFGYRRRIDV